MILGTFFCNLAFHSHQNSYKALLLRLVLYKLKNDVITIQYLHLCYLSFDLLSDTFTRKHSLFSTDFCNFAAEYNILR